MDNLYFLNTKATQRRVYLDSHRYVVCDITNENDDFDKYHFSFEDSYDELIKAMKDNGMVISVSSKSEKYISVDRRFWNFRNELYILNQCSDLFDWLIDSEVGEFTYYYKNLLFHTPEGIYSAYADNTHNYCKI